MLKSRLKEMHDKGHPNDMQAVCHYCLFEKQLPPAHEVTKKVFELIDDITDDYKKKHLRG